MDQLDKLSVAKFAVRFAVTGGTAKIVRSIIENNTDPETLTEKVQIFAGTFALGGMVAAEVGKYTDVKVDECVEQYQSFKKFIQEVKSEVQE